jgi:GxxExxY protein
MGGLHGRVLAAKDITREILAAFYEVFDTLGAGFLESVYAAALERELLQRGLGVAREVSVVVVYKGVEIVHQRIDFIVNDSVIVECKAGPVLHPSSRQQLRNYLRATGLEVGLVLHFGQRANFVRWYEPTNK